MEEERDSADKGESRLKKKKKTRIESEDGSGGDSGTEKTDEDVEMEDDAGEEEVAPPKSTRRK
jgi:hypothetical protein